MSAIELRERDLGQLLGHVLEVASDQFGRLFLIQLVIGMPLLAANLVLQPSLTGLEPDASPEAVIRIALVFWGKMVALTLIMALTTPVEMATTARFVRRLVEDQPPRIGPCLLEALRLWPRMLLLTVTLGVMMTVGTLLCWVPGILVSVWFFVAAPAHVLEGVSWTSAFGRSRELVGGIGVGGRFFEVLAVYLMCIMVPGLVLAPVLMALSLVPSPTAQVLIGHFLTISMMVPAQAAPTVVYYHLRVMQEGHDIDRLADLVDVIGKSADGLAAPASGAPGPA